MLDRESSDPVVLKWSIGRALKESKLPFILMDRSVVPVRKIYGEIFLYNISIQVACRGYDYETAGYFALRVGVDRERRRKVLRRMGIGKGAVTDGPMPMLMKKDEKVIIKMQY